MKRKLSKISFCDTVKEDKSRIEELLYEGLKELTEWEQGFLEDCLSKLELGRELTEGARNKLNEIEE